MVHTSTYHPALFKIATVKCKLEKVLETCLKQRTIKTWSDSNYIYLCRARTLESLTQVMTVLQCHSVSVAAAKSEVLLTRKLTEMPVKFQRLDTRFSEMPNSFELICQPDPMLADTWYRNGSWNFAVISFHQKAITISGFSSSHFYIRSRLTSVNVSSNIFDLGDFKTKA